MASISRAVTIPAESELARRLAEAARAGTPVAIDTGTAVYEVAVRQAPAVAASDLATSAAAPEHGPEAFYARLTQRPDLRAILQRLAR